MQDDHPVIADKRVSPGEQQGDIAFEASTTEYGPIRLTDIPRILYEEFRDRAGAREEYSRELNHGDFFRSVYLAVPPNCHLCYGRMRGREYLLLIDEDPYPSLAVTIQDTMLMSVVVKPSWRGRSGHIYQNQLFAVVPKKSIPLQFAYSRLMAEIEVRAYMLGEKAQEEGLFQLEDGKEPFRHVPFYERILFGEND